MKAQPDIDIAVLPGKVAEGRNDGVVAQVQVIRESRRVAGGTWAAASRWPGLRPSPADTIHRRPPDASAGKKNDLLPA